MSVAMYARDLARGCRCGRTGLADLPAAGPIFSLWGVVWAGLRLPCLRSHAYAQGHMAPPLRLNYIDQRAIALSITKLKVDLHVCAAYLYMYTYICLQAPPSSVVPQRYSRITSCAASWIPVLFSPKSSTSRNCFFSLNGLEGEDRLELNGVNGIPGSITM